MPVHFQGSSSEVLALEAWVKLNRGLETVQSRLQQKLGEAGLTERQLGVLEALLHLGPMCQRELGRKLLRGDSNMTAVLETLERGGLVLRTRRVEDRRQVLVELTAAGRARIESIFPSHVRAVEQAMGALTAEEQVVLARLCKKLGLANAKADGGRS